MTQPLCRYCGKKIAKRTRTVWFVKERLPHMRDESWGYHVVGTPATKAEAQRLVNETIVNVKRGQNPWDRQTPEYIRQVSIWDGESYVDPFFCNGNHAKDFAYMVAKAKPGYGTTDYVTALKGEKNG